MIEFGSNDGPPSLAGCGNTQNVVIPRFTRNDTVNIFFPSMFERYTEIVFRFSAMRKVGSVTF